MMFLLQMYFLYEGTPGEYNDHTYDVVLESLSPNHQRILVSAVNY